MKQPVVNELAVGLRGAPGPNPQSSEQLSDYGFVKNSDVTTAPATAEFA